MKKGLLLIMIAVLLVTGCSTVEETGNYVEERNGYETTSESSSSKKTKSETIKYGETKTIKAIYDDEEVEASIKFEDIYVSSSVNPPEPRQSYYTYYPEYDNKTYLVVVLDVKNLGGKTLNTDYVFTNFLGDDCTMKVKVDGKYEYEANTVVGLEKDSDGKYDFDKYYDMDALDQSKLYILYQIPTEVKDKSMNTNICLGETTINLVK